MRSVPKPLAALLTWGMFFLATTAVSEEGPPQETPARGVISLTADAFQGGPEWRREGGALVATGPGQAGCEVVLPEGRFDVWARTKGDLQLTIAGREIPLARPDSIGWSGAGELPGGRLPIVVSSAGPDAELHEMLFVADPEYSPVAPFPPKPADEAGPALWLDFDGRHPFGCRDRALGHHVRASGQLARARGPWGGALPCPRFAVRVDSSDSLAASEALTVEAWVRADETSGYRTVAFKGRRSDDLQAIHFDLDLYEGMPELKFKDADGRWHGILRSGSYDLPAIQPGAWGHLAATFDRGQVRLYLDGEPIASQQTPVDRLVPNDFPLLVGEAQNAQGRKDYRFAGLIDDVRVYLRALAPEEIALRHREGRPAHPRAPAHAEKMQDDDAPDPTFEHKLKLVEQYERNVPEDTLAGSATMASVGPHEGVPSLFINGEPVFPMAMIPIGHFPRQVCRDFAAAGVHVYSHILWSWNVIVPEQEDGKPEDLHWWLGPGQYAFEKIDRQILPIIEADPQAYIFLRVKLNPPDWWLREHPDELTHYDDGRRGPQVSMASEAWQETYERMLRDLIRHVEKSPYAGHIIGYQPAGGGSSEWFWWGFRKGLIDYSPAARKRFRKWLKEKYGDDVAALRKSWNDEQASFDTAEPPDRQAREASEYLVFRDARKAGRVVDFQRFLSDLTAENIVRSCRICKEETGGRKIAGVFYGYSAHMSTGRLGLWNNGFLGLKRVLDSPHVDFLCSPTDYGHRRGGEPGNFISAYVGSYMLHNKLYWDEADVRTHLYQGPASYASRSRGETISVFQRGFAYMLTKGTALWWFTLAGDHTFHEHELMETIAQMPPIGRASMDDRKPPIRDVAVLIDEETFFHMRMGVDALTGPLVRDMYLKLAVMGAPFDVYLLSDVADPRMPDYKLYLFLNPFYLDNETRQAIRRKVRRDGAVSVWFYAPGFLGPDGSFREEAIGDLTGIRVRHQAEERPLDLAVTNFDHAITAEVCQSDCFESTAPLGPVFWADDPEALMLGRLSPGGPAGLVVREFDSWRSVYCAAPGVPTAILRGLVRYAGGHVYSTSDDPFSANERYLMIHTSTGGMKRIALPGPREVTDVLEGDIVGRDARSIDVELPAGVTRIYRLQSPE